MHGMGEESRHFFFKIAMKGGKRSKRVDMWQMGMEENEEVGKGTHGRARRSGVRK